MPEESKRKRSKSWEKWETVMGRKVPATNTSEKRDALLQKLLSLGKRNPTKFRVEGEAEDVGPMYRRPLTPRLQNQLNKSLQDLKELQEKTEEKAKLEEIDKAHTLVSKVLRTPEKELLYVNPGRHPSILAHEVGHASRPNLAAKAVAGASTHLGNNSAVSAISSLAGLAGGALGNSALTGTGVGLGALKGLTGLVEEGRASLRGLKLLEESGYHTSPEEKKALLKAWSSYLPSAIGNAGVPAFMAGLGYMGREYLKHASVARSQGYRDVWSKVAKVDTKLEALAKPSLLNKIEHLFVPSDVEHKYDADKLRKGIRREAYRIRKQYGLKPKLTGSMHSGLNLPDSVDIDFFADVQDRQKFDDVLATLEKSETFTPSPYNKPGAGYAVFTRQDPGTSGFPVDLAVAYGGPGAEYREATTKLRRGVTMMDPELKSKLMAKKQLLRDTPLFSKSRYRRFKREMRDAMGVPTLSREKLSYIVDPKIREEKDKLIRFLKRKDVVGHRTTAGKGIIESGGALPAAELYRRGLLQDIELGRKGDRQAVAQTSLDKIRRHLKNTVYATRRGLLNDPEYGNVGFVAISRTAKDSPFLNLISDEAIVGPRKSGVNRRLGIGKGYVFAPREQIEEFEQLKPEYKYVVEDELDPEIQKALYKPSTRSLKEIFKRIIPSTLKGNLKIHPLGGRVEPGYGEE